MAAPSLYVSCRRIVQEWICPRSQLQSYTNKHISRRLYTPFSTVRRLSSSAAPSPAAYQPKQVADSGKNPTGESNSPARPPDTNFQPTTGLTTSERLALSMRKNLPSLTETYVAYGACEKLVTECARHAAYSMPLSIDEKSQIPTNKDGVQIGVGKGWWYETLGLDPTFENWAQVTFLHMYLITVRFRCFPPQVVQIWHQHLIDQFSYMAEHKMTVDHKMTNKAQRQGHLKAVFVQWRGLQTGYDEGLIKGDAVLATAVWRNIFKADPNVDWRSVAEVVAYMRHILQMLASMSDEDIACGELTFGADPGSERAGVLLRAKGMDDKGAGESSKVMPSAKASLR